MSKYLLTNPFLEIYKLYTFYCTDCFGAMVEIAFILPVVLQYDWDTQSPGPNALLAP